ncbi:MULTISPECIES: hypothetical protein [Shewanella]|uniref:hypothetical protein n=1 Tax=Shewanella TaxID=22 RepID=UPI00201A6A32|nr:hypothetical protein [Shewanella sp. 10B]
MAYIKHTSTLARQPLALFGLCLSVTANASLLDVDDPGIAERCELQLGWQQPRSDHSASALKTAATCNQGQWEWHLGFEHQHLSFEHQHLSVEEQADSSNNQQQTELGIKLPLPIDTGPWQSALAINLQHHHQDPHPIATEVLSIMGYQMAERDLRLYSNLGFYQHAAQSPQLIAGIAIALAQSEDQQWIGEIYRKAPEAHAYRLAYQWLLKRQLQLEFSLGNDLKGNAQQFGADITFFFG